MPKSDLSNWCSLGPDGFLIPQFLAGVKSEDVLISRQAVNELIGRLANWPSFDSGFGTITAFKSALQNDIPLHIVFCLIDFVSDQSINEEYRGAMLEALCDASCYVEAAKVYTNPENKEDEIYRVRARAIWDAIREGTPIYEALLKSEYEAIWLSAKHLLWLFQKEATF